MRYGLYEWVAIPMGLRNTPATFIQTMNYLFSDTLDSGMAVFLDEILTYLCIVKEHFTLLEKVLVFSHQYTFYCKLKKCSSLCNSTIFLTFYVMPEDLCISNSKVQSLNK